MATKRTTTEILPPEDSTISPGPVQPFPWPNLDEDTTEDVALSNVLADLGGESDAKVNVYRMESGKGNVFVGSFDPQSFTIEDIQRQFGGGEYKIHVRSNGRLVANRTIRVAESKIAQYQHLPAPAPSIDKAEIAKLAETMQQGFQAMGSMFAQTLQNIQANQLKPKSTLEMLQEMQVMRDIFAPAQNAAQSPFDIFRQGVEFAKEIQPREGEPGTGEIILEAIKNFGGLMQQAQSAAPSAARPMIPSVSPVAANPAPPENGPVSVVPIPASPVPSIPVPESEDMNAYMRRMYLNLLVANARANNDPSTYAAMALDLQGEEAVLEFARNPAWFELLVQERPEIAEFKEWFTEMWQNIFLLTNNPVPGTDKEAATDSSVKDAIQPAPAPQ